MHRCFVLSLCLGFLRWLGFVSGLLFKKTTTTHTHTHNLVVKISFFLFHLFCFSVVYFGVSFRELPSVSPLNIQAF